MTHQQIEQLRRTQQEILKRLAVLEKWEYITIGVLVANLGIQLW